MPDDMLTSAFYQFYARAMRLVGCFYSSNPVFAPQAHAKEMNEGNREKDGTVEVETERP